MDLEIFFVLVSEFSYTKLLATTNFHGLKQIRSESTIALRVNFNLQVEESSFFFSLRRNFRSSISYFNSMALNQRLN